ncbi:hypothetical protein [Calidifontibacillus oryziterrae]|uniref:hypothetical protein n=1 Tax=Calidifontibacillus oryziterrae TaxID=1191699 RepID=UPI0003170360|nr:hypothetical protein [Calidifontibacillus oryziterrae]
MDKGNEDEVVRMEQEDHDWLILYTIQPDPEKLNLAKAYKRMDGFICSSFF